MSIACIRSEHGAAVWSASKGPGSSTGYWCQACAERWLSPTEVSGYVDAYGNIWTKLVTEEESMPTAAPKTAIAKSSDAFVKPSPFTSTTTVTPVTAKVVVAPRPSLTSAEAVAKAGKTRPSAANVVAPDRDKLDEMLRAIPAQDHLLFWGPRGTSKTTTATMLLGADSYSITCYDNQSAASFLGHFVATPNGDVWMDGPGTRAWIEGKGLIVNEIDHMSEEVSNLFHVLADAPDVARITLVTGRTIKPAPGFRIIGTMNGSPAHLHDAVLDRFGVILHFTRPSKAQLEELPGDVRVACLGYYKKTAPGEEPEVTYRNFAAFARLRQSLDWQVAAALAVPDGVINGKAQAMLEAIMVNGTKA